MPTLTDKQAREIIINELDKNIFVMAGAGSGKTSMLVNRMVALVEAGKDISKICAITFTINAAAEFLERLNKTLKRRSLGITNENDFKAGGLGEITPEKQKYDEEALKNIDLCFAGTIDSFCNLMLSQYPLDAGIPSSSTVLTDEEADVLYRKEYAKLSLLKKNDENYQAFVKLFKNPSEVFSNSIEDAISVSFFNVVYDKPTISLDAWAKDFKDRYQTQLQRDIRAIENNQDSLKDTGGNKKVFNSFNKSFKRFLVEWDLDAILRLPKFGKDAIYDLKFKDDPNINGCIAYCQKNKDFVYQVGCAFDDAIKEIQKVKYTYGLDFLLSCAQSVRQELKEKGKLTFSEYLFTFKEIIKNDLNSDECSPIINHIRERFQYFLLDESQDTSPFQYELFLYLNSEKPATKIEEVKLIPGGLFIVGDPKQSIYRFRNADINSYNNVKALFNDDDNIVVELTNNFRSSKKLCEYFNYCFTVKKDLPSYTPISNVDDKETDGYEGLFKYSNYIEVIKTIIDNPEYQILKDGVPSKIQYSDIMVIAKSKKNKLSLLVNELEKEKIPCYAEDDNLLSDYDAVVSICAAYCYLTYPQDRQYFYNLMISPLFGLTAGETLSVDESKLSSEQADILNKIKALNNIKDPVMLFESLVENAHLFNGIQSKRLDYVYYIQNKLKEAYSSNLITSKEDTALFLNNLLIEKQERIAQLSKKPNAVRISNVHKVKGLEAPVVILIKGGADSGAKNKITKHIDHVNQKSYFFRIGKNEYGKSTTYEAEYIYDLNEEKLELEFSESEKEFTRLQYVAVTRARDYLFIPDDEKFNVWYELISDEFEDFEPDYERIAAFDEKDNSISDDQVYQNNPEPMFVDSESYSIILPSKLRINHEGSSEEREINDKSTNDAAEKGTLIHALMEIYVLSNMKYNNADVVEEVLSRYGQKDNDEYRQLLTKTIDVMTSGGFVQSSGQKEDLFATLKQASEIYCELPFSYQEGNNIYNGSIDLFYKLDDKYYIVDYKTNYDGDNLDEKYAEQLSSYQKAVKQVGGIEATARIYHIDIK